MKLDALDSIQTEMLTEPMAKEQGIAIANWDLRATKLVRRYNRVITLLVRNVCGAWDRGPRRANKVH